MSRKLQFQCPTCGSADVFYSCEPKCCFNHVCAECKTTFEPVTLLASKDRRRIDAPDPPPECTEPTVACCVCESVRVFLDDDDALVCMDCGAVLKMELTDVTA
ncbi:MAG: hypothetical protein HYZ37_11585 [Candidatus Solibacter usitatus]|nr:hypothetical protein [Candidatus Solibacter usitatus]